MGGAIIRSLISSITLGLALLSAAGMAMAQGGSSSRDARAKANEWTIGIAAGLPEDSLLPFSSEIARNINAAGNLRVLTLATPGAADNIKDLLFLSGVDVALTQTDVLHHLRTVEKMPLAEKQVQYIAALHLSQVHLLARPEINSIRDLAGKKVGFNVVGAGPTITAPIIFHRLKVNVEPVHVGTAQALAMMQTGELSALVHIVAKPNSLLSSYVNTSGFKLLPIPFEALEDFYIPVVLTSTDYPNFIRPGQRIDTVAVQAILAVLEKPSSADRGRRIKRFVELFFDRFERFAGPGFQPAWREVSLSAQIPGWTRSELATEKLRQLVSAERDKVTRVGLINPAEQERLFQRFLEWLKKQPNSR